MWLDTLPLARQVLPQLAAHSQASLQQALGIPAAALQHRAKEDVEMLEQVLLKLAGRRGLAALMAPGASYHGSFGPAKEVTQ